MHVDTHVLELEYYNYENVKPFKSKISIWEVKVLGIYFLICMQNAFCVCNMVKHALKIQ
jgi:hypothetical protein